METKEKLEVLSNPAWTYKEIMLYFDIKAPATAIKLKDRAIKEKNGSVPFGSKYVKCDSVLALFGSNREQEISLLKGIINNEEIIQENVIQK